MSRSYYHTPIMGVTGHPSCKKWRQQENQRYRRYAKVLTHKGLYDSISPYKGRWANEWDSPRDGKTYFGHMKYRECVDIYTLGEYPYYKYPLLGCFIDKDIHFCYKYYNELMRK